MNLGLFITFVMAGLIGTSLGLLGSGGSVITLPVLVYVAGISPEKAVAMSLAIVGGTSVIGSLYYARKGWFDPRAALVLGITGMLGAYPGAYLTHWVSQSMLMLLFSVLMLVVGVRMLTSRSCGESRDQHLRGTGLLIGVGLGVGVLTGFLGVGGGFLIIPALTLFGGRDLKIAAGTSLAVIALNSASGLAAHVRHVELDWTLTLSLLVISILGLIAGGTLAGHLTESSLRKTFAWGVIGVAVLVLARSFVFFGAV